VTDPHPVQVWRFTPAKPKAGNESGGGPTVGPEALPVQDEFRVEFPGAPAEEYSANRVDVRPQGVGERLKVRGQRDDTTDVEIAVRPAVPPPPDSLRQRIGNNGMAQRALNPDRYEGVTLEEPRQAYDSVQAKQFDGHGGIVQDLPAQRAELARDWQEAHRNPP
jgi:hypothetical protein